MIQTDKIIIVERDTLSAQIIIFKLDGARNSHRFSQEWSLCHYFGEIGQYHYTFSQNPFIGRLDTSLVHDILVVLVIIVAIVLSRLVGGIAAWRSLIDIICHLKSTGSFVQVDGKHPIIRPFRARNISDVVVHDLSALALIRERVDRPTVRQQLRHMVDVVAIDVVVIHRSGLLGPSKTYGDT